MVRSANGEAGVVGGGGGGQPRRPSIKESTPTPRSVAVGGGSSISAPPRLLVGGGRGGGATYSKTPPKETPYYPSSISMFFPFGSSSASASTTSVNQHKTRPLAPLGSAEEALHGSVAPLPPKNVMVAGSLSSSQQGPAKKDEEENAAGLKGGTMMMMNPPAATTMKEASSTLQSLLVALEDNNDDDAATAGLDDYPNVVRYGNLPLLLPTETFPESMNSSATSSTSSSIVPPRSAFRVTNVPLATILARIATFLKLQSITCDPKGLVKDRDGVLACVTRRHCQFAIMMWRLEEDQDQDFDGRPPNEDASQPPHDVLIAIERRQGCCVELQRMRQALKKSIETGLFESSSSPAASESVGCHQAFLKSIGGSRTIAPLVKKLYQSHVLQQVGSATAAGPEPDSAPLDDSSSSSQQPTTSSSKSSVRRRSSLDGISTCASLLASQCQYKQQLGLENLVALTDPSSGGVDLDTAMDVTDALLLQHSNDSNEHSQSNSYDGGGGEDSDNESEDDDDELFKKLQQEFISFFINPEDSFHDVTKSQAFALAMSPTASAPKVFPDLTESPLQRTIRHSLALEALCNALQVTKSAFESSDHPPEPGLDLRSDFWRVVIPALLMDVANARSRPHDAALSAKCLALLQDLHRHHEGSGGGGGAPAQSTNRQSSECFMCLDYIESLLPYLVQARSYGSRHHLLLEREANELIGRLQQRSPAGQSRGMSQQQTFPPQLQTF